MNNLPQFSIDLQAELQKITQRQHLNDVHYLVGLVRHAIACRPKRISIASSRKLLIFSQDGDPPDIAEWEALLELLKPDPLREAQQQKALTLLETRYGVILLSLLLNSEKAVFRTGNHELHMQSGQWIGLKPCDVLAGYHLEVYRTAQQRDKEASELDFYCSGASVPIFFNDKQINQPLRLSQHLLALNFKDTKGHGSIGIPAEGELSRFYFFKAGIRIGVKTFSPSNGKVVEGYWNTTLPEFEPLYKQTIQLGQSLLEQHAQSLYQAIADQFRHLTLEHRHRIKKILLGLDGLEWSKNFGTIPLFANSAKPFALSYTDLRRMRKRHGVIPFSTDETHHNPYDVPVLAFEDQYFLRQTLRQPLLPLIGVGPFPTNPKIHQQPNPQPTAYATEPAWQLFLEQLNQPHQPFTFIVTHGKARVEHLLNGLTKVYLPHNHALVKQAFVSVQKDSQSAPLWRYRLLDAFSY